MSGDQRDVSVATGAPEQEGQDGQTGSLGKIDESSAEPSAVGLRSTIKSKLNLNEFYDKLTKTPRDISGLFHRNKMERHSTMIGEAQSSARDQLNAENVGGSEDEEEDDDDEEDEGRRMGNTSSPKNLNDDDFLFSFEDFSCIAKTPSSAIGGGGVTSQNMEMMGLDSGCCEEVEREKEQGRIKPRRLNIGEIGRSASAKNPDSGIDLGSSGCGGVGVGVNKRQLLSDIGRRFSEMDESSNCEFRSDSLRQVGSQPSGLLQFRPNSVPVSPRPRMILPSQHHHHHRDSSDFSVNTKKRNSLFREYSTQVRRRN